jgi:hypothetical protein
MTVSKAHKNLSEWLEDPDVLTNPEPFLGPNWETVLRWWLYEESLTDEQYVGVFERYNSIDDNLWRDNYDLVENAAKEVIGDENYSAVYWAHCYPEVAGELIALHTLKEPIFLPIMYPNFIYRQT